jgi:hypothetical protein
MASNKLPNPLVTWQAHMFCEQDNLTLDVVDWSLRLVAVALIALFVAYGSYVI